MRRIALALLFLAGCSRKPDLPVYFSVPPFVMTAQTGDEFRSESLKGNIWVADFIFTNCGGPCPRMSAQMRRVQEQTKDLAGVKLVSFSVDPQNDTPEVLAAYAKRYRAEPGRWFFLTGPEATLEALDQNGFKVGNEGLAHSTRFILVDGQGRIRGYYSSSDEDAVERVVADIRRLAGS